MSSESDSDVRDDQEESEEEEYHFPLYAGKGQTLSERRVKLVAPPSQKGMDAPKGYIAPEGLPEAVNVALALRMPLLVTGEPGTGKTQLAYSVAYELEWGKPRVFHTKSTSTYRDLFYYYDALRHFHDAQYLKNESLPEVEHYIEYRALGEAIIVSMSAEARRHGDLPRLPSRLLDAPPQRSVVLIDEVDKAPRDLPNDILNEIERMTFSVPEARRKTPPPNVLPGSASTPGLPAWSQEAQNVSPQEASIKETITPASEKSLSNEDEKRAFTADTARWPLVILTSNSEKELPDAFLRRCAFFHIAFPNRATLRQIVDTRVPFARSFPTDMREGVAMFEAIRALDLRKIPATSELLRWVNMLIQQGQTPRKIVQLDPEALAITCCLLTKSKDDGKHLAEDLKDKKKWTSLLDKAE